MIQLTLQNIKNIASHDHRFKDGFMLYQKGKVSFHKPASHHGLAFNTLDQDQTYRSTVYFYPDTGTFNHSKCSCSMAQPCPHVIGSMLYVLYHKDELSKAMNSKQENLMFRAFKSQLVHSTLSGSKQLLHIEPIITPVDCRKQNKQSKLSLRIGPANLYQVRHIEQFIQAYKDNKSYELHTRFTYNPYLHTFSESDKAMLELLDEFFETKKLLVSDQYATFTSPSKAASQTLPSPYFKRLLRLISHRPFTLDMDGFIFKEQELLGHSEIDFFFELEDNDYHLSVNSFDEYFPLTPDYEYVFYNNQISHLGQKAAKAFELFCHYLKEKQLIIHEDQLDEFMNTMMPVLAIIGYFHMPDKLMNQYEQHPLTANLYLEKVDGAIALRLVLHYGPYQLTIIPYEEMPAELHLLRDLEKETQIINLIESISHKRHENGLLLFTEDDDIFEFTQNQLPTLLDLCQVYYSEDFKHTYLQRHATLTARMQYHENLGLLELDFEAEDVDRSELYDILRAVKEKKHYYKLKDGSFFAINEQMTTQFAAIEDRFGDDLNFDGDGPLLSTIGANAFYLDNLLKQHSMTQATNDALKALVRRDGYEVKMLPLQDEFNNVLRDYQKIGYEWLSHLSNHGLGGILADDMGLGKTLQALTLMLHDPTELPSIVVAPTSLIYNWEEEVHKFAPHKATKVIAGTKAERDAAISDIKQEDLVITSYGALKRDLEAYDFPFAYCIIDEAQHIKNPNSQNAKAVKGLMSKHRFALTGTPIENTLTELWSIFDFILPGYLYKHSDFIKRMERPIVKDQDTRTLNLLTKLIEPFILRRLKKDVLLELPDKIETKVMVDLNKHQKKLYQAYVEQAKTDLASQSHMNAGQKQVMILSILTKLRQICCHPSLFMENYQHDSAKLDLLMELLEDSLEGGHRVLVFSQFTSMLALVKTALEKKKMAYFYLDGNIAPMKRQQMVHDFNTGNKDIFLISLKAGGTGLNLTGADVVIHYDPWWNPAVENQATDRAYRIGQDKVVQVYKLITTGTIEEKIYQLQQQKLSLIENVIQPGETFIHKLSSEELAALFDNAF